MTVRADLTGKYWNRMYTYEPEDISTCEWNGHLNDPFLAIWRLYKKMWLKEKGIGESQEMLDLFLQYKKLRAPYKHEVNLVCLLGKKNKTKQIFLKNWVVKYRESSFQCLNPAGGVSKSHVSLAPKPHLLWFKAFTDLNGLLRFITRTAEAVLIHLILAVTKV